MPTVYLSTDPVEKQICRDVVIDIFEEYYGLSIGAIFVGNYQELFLFEDELYIYNKETKKRIREDKISKILE